MLNKYELQALFYLLKKLLQTKQTSNIIKRHATGLLKGLQQLITSLFFS